MTGTLTLNHPLTNTPGTKKIKVKGAATATACSGTETGGKGPIVAATVKISGSLPVGATCVSLAAPTFGPTKIQVKWQYLNPKGKLATAAVNNTTLASAALASPDPAVLQIVTAPLVKASFIGATITLNVGLDDPIATLLGECGGAGITSLGFGASTPSTVTSP